MNNWEKIRLDQMIELQRGHDLPLHERNQGNVPILGSNGVVGFHDQARYSGPGVTIGRSGVIGGATYTDEPYWPLNTCLFVKDFKSNYPRWVYYWLKSADFSAVDSGSAQPSLNRNYIAGYPVWLPSPDEQQAIAEVLGALDDKIAANTKLSNTAQDLAGRIYDQATSSFPQVPMSSCLTPILGGTPKRSTPHFWDGNELWASAKDITNAPFSVITDTDEKITLSATKQTKAKPLPAGSVIVTARGTVGAVARLATPSSFNQSCYGFIPKDFPPGLLYFSVLNAAEQAKTLAHGSVFDTITMRSFDNLMVPDFGDSSDHLESQIAPILDLIEVKVQENETLVKVRDTLLPQLMSGKLKVNQAEEIVASAV